MFEDCRPSGRPDAGRGKGRGYRIALSNPWKAGPWIGIAAPVVGMARSAYEVALAYAKERTSMGQPLIGHQAVAFRLADMATRIESAPTDGAATPAALRDAGRPPVSRRRRWPSFRRARGTWPSRVPAPTRSRSTAAMGVLEDYPVERIYRDVRVCPDLRRARSDIQRLNHRPPDRGRRHRRAPLCFQRPPPPRLGWGSAIPSRCQDLPPGPFPPSADPPLQADGRPDRVLLRLLAAPTATSPPTGSTKLAARHGRESGVEAVPAGRRLQGDRRRTAGRHPDEG